MSDSPYDRLWQEYVQVFRQFDDLTLARWLAQTLGQLQGRLWRLSHPLIGAFRLGAQEAHERQIWLKRLATPPPAYPEADCCRAPLLPLFTRDVFETGLICQHCGGTAVALDALPQEVKANVQNWADEYAAAHSVAHWDDRQRKSVKDYDRACQEAAHRVEMLLNRAATQLLPQFLDHYPALVWEDQDECLEVRPEDIGG